MVAYLTISGAAPWIVPGFVVGVVALILRAKSPESSRRPLLLLAAAAFVFAVLGVLVLAASRYCAGVGGCTH
jgi:hypothetical protein